MQTIKSVISKYFEEISIEELIQCFESVKDNGDIGFIKFDGARTTDHYTVFISTPESKSDIIRADESTLKVALVKVLKQYVEVKKNA
ncbi:hypothetical protein L3C95_15985 [Chitinophaga filiformis]|uniref:hypothetical protein n=1 Tax=Chitinophaga filiformis TaxID=104663 RepID=UPI001F3DF4AB|nr:hypothetical protein [Chitinophaga filiformis]MCF6404398.1 hypothetical protein [Chitinophaga filiformis]